jgi:hypothetical protein
MKQDFTVRPGRTRWPGGVPECCQPLFFDSQGFLFPEKHLSQKMMRFDKHAQSEKSAGWRTAFAGPRKVWDTFFMSER